MKRPTALLILDGWGCSEEEEGNAVRLARTPTFDRLWRDWPHATLTTFGPAVGLPEGQMGNSEVGHLNIGAGRVVFQELPRINRAIAEGDLARRLAESGLAERLKATGGACHLAGLVSDGGVHAHMDHALAIARILAKEGVRVLVHAFTDGRDTPPRSARELLPAFEEQLPQGAAIATLSGRYFAMDRDKRWDRVAKAYDAMTRGAGPHAASLSDALAMADAADIGDEFIEPAVIGGYAGMEDGDALCFFNFRADRARQLLQALLEPGFDAFERARTVDFSACVGMVDYGAGLAAHMGVLFPAQLLDDGLSETVARAGLTQLHMAETEKYPHVTYFLNGGREAPFDGEDRLMVPSPKVATYDLKPEMSAVELTERVVEAIDGGKYDFLVVNFANPDMVGHTGDIDAAIRAVETVDAALARIVDALDRRKGAAMIIADHGNCEMMIDPATGGPHTAHTTNPVPVLVSAGKAAALHDGILADVAPTLLALMGLDQPAAMTGRSLIG